MRHLPRFFDYSTELSYSKIERVTDVNDINHPAIREAMKYLDMQGDNPTYSAGNIALVMFQDPEAPYSVRRSGGKPESGRDRPGAKQGSQDFARNTLGRGYRLTDAYDIRQTQGARPEKRSS